MQLESSVFAMCVVQLKPQLELLLGLPPNSLMKEIQLTQNLLSLFIDYQIPSDLLTYDGDATASSSEKVNVVKHHVSSVLDMISQLKEKELKDAEQAADMRFETTSLPDQAVDAPLARSQGLMLTGNVGRRSHSVRKYKCAVNTRPEQMFLKMSKA